MLAETGRSTRAVSTACQSSRANGFFGRRHLPAKKQTKQEPMKTGVTESGQNLTEWVGNQGNRISKNKKGEWLGTYCEGDSDPSDRLSKSDSVLLAAKPGELASLQNFDSAISRVTNLVLGSSGMVNHTCPTCQKSEASAG